jgi:alpha-1,2-mannosyltransferase
MTHVAPRPWSAPLVTALREAPWLTRERALAYGRILLAMSLAAAVIWTALAHGGLDRMGKPLGTDYASFWTASQLALAGHPLQVYDIAAHHAAQTRLFGRDVGYAAFFYPPIYLLICLPLALLPYFASLAVWLGVTGLAYWRVVRAWLGERFGALAIFAFPAVLVNIGHGQNGFLTTALFGGGALMLDRRPLVAGVLFGCMVYKPQLGLVIPLALIAAGRWKTIAAAVATVVVLAGLSAALFGLDAWRGFLAVSPVAKAALEQDLVGYAKMQSTFAAVRLLHGGPGLAYALQIVVALAACAGLVLLQRRAFRGGAEGPAMVTAALLVSPFLLDYDLLLLAIPLAWMAREGLRTGFRSWEKLVMVLAFVLPLMSRSVASTVGLPLAPLVIGALLVLVLRRGLEPAAAATKLAPGLFWLTSA